LLMPKRDWGASKAAHEIYWMIVEGENFANDKEGTVYNVGLSACYMINNLGQKNCRSMSKTIAIYKC
jgi:hypothetical protein